MPQLYRPMLRLVLSHRMSKDVTTYVLRAEAGGRPTHYGLSNFPVTVFVPASYRI